MRDAGRREVAQLLVASRPLPGAYRDLTRAQREAVQRTLRLIEAIRRRASRARAMEAAERRRGRCARGVADTGDLDRVLGWREVERPEWVNVLAIVGGRAHGKTTALMAVLRHLRGLHLGNDGGELPGASGCDIVLPPIDPEMFNGTPEFVLSWVFARLARFLTALECRASQWQCLDPESHGYGDRRESPPLDALRRAQERLEPVKKAIALLSSRYSEKAIQLTATRSEFQGEVFEQQKAGLELREHIHRFFDALFDLIDTWVADLPPSRQGGDGEQDAAAARVRYAVPLLVIPFDDIDLAEERAPQLLHAVHSYLVHPRVVTVLLGDWSAFSLALHREHARGALASELMPGDGRLRRSVERLVDAALLKYLPAQNISELLVDEGELFGRFEQIFARLDGLLAGPAADEGVSGPLTSLFRPRIALPKLPEAAEGGELETGGLLTPFAGVLAPDLRGFNALRAAFAELAEALAAWVDEERAQQRSEDVLGRYRETVGEALRLLRGRLAWSGKSWRLREQFERVLFRREVDLRKLAGAGESLPAAEFERLLLVVLLYLEIHRLVARRVGLQELEVRTTAEARLELWRRAIVAPRYPWVEESDLPIPAEPARWAPVEALATGILRWLAREIHVPSPGGLMGYLTSGAPAQDPLARMLVRCAVALAALQVDAKTALAAVPGPSPDEGGTDPGGEAVGEGAAMPTGGRSPRLEAFGTWLEAAARERRDALRSVLAREWYLSGVSLYRTEEMVRVGESPLDAYRDLIMRRWFWSLLATGADRGPEDEAERIAWLAGLLRPVALERVRAGTLELPELLALFIEGLLEPATGGEWVATGRGYDLLAQERRERGRRRGRRPRGADRRR